MIQILLFPSNWIQNQQHPLKSFNKQIRLIRTVISFPMVSYISGFYLETYRAKATIAHTNSMMALTIDTLAPLHRSPLQQSIRHLMIFTEG